MATNRVYRIAVIPGDGIGKEVMPEGVRVLEAAAKKFGFELRNDDFDFASYDYYARHERMMPEDRKSTRLNSSHLVISYAVFCLKKKNHNHAIVSIHAMKMGKHVYCEKPLTRTIYEARQMAKVAKEMNVQTQMGTQGHAFEGSRQAVDVIRSGAIGDVSEVHVWSDRPGSWWQQGIERPTDEPPVPPTLDWDTWLGPAPARPYNKAYVPFTWRGFWDFGTGAIGDMGIHNFDTAFWALELGLPTTVEVKDTSGVNNETGPKWCIIEINFPARGAKPPVKLMWYDGLKKPPTELFQGEKRLTNGSLIIGSKGTLFTRTWHGGGETANPEEDFYLL